MRILLAEMIYGGVDCGGIVAENEASPFGGLGK